MNDPLPKVFRNQAAKVRKAIKLVKDGAKVEDDAEFSLPNFWLHFTIAVDALSNSVTRLAFMLTKPPLPDVKTAQDLAGEVEKAYWSLLETVRSIPQSQGGMLTRAIDATLVSILTALENYFNACHKNPSDPKQAELVGIIWRACEAIPELPKDNKEAVMKVLENEDQLMKDAVDELEEELKTQRSIHRSQAVTNGEEQWSETELRLVEAGLALVKTTREGAKRSLDLVATSDCDTSQLDLVANVVELLSPLLDDFISSIYPPLDAKALPEQVEQVVKTLGTLLELIEKCQFIKPQDHNWLTTVRQELSANDDLLQALMSSEEILEIASLVID